MTSDIPESKCLECGAVMRKADSVMDEGKPEPGMLSMCAECGAVSIFAEDMTLRGFTDAEYKQIMTDPAFAHLRRQIAIGARFVRALQKARHQRN